MDLSQRRPTIDRDYEISLLQSLTGEHLRIPLAAMREVGAASQVLAGLLRVSRKETYVMVAKIARVARVALPMARRHLKVLAAAGYIKNEGRGHTRRGAPRRTCTLKVMPKAREAAKEYAVLPWWACERLRRPQGKKKRGQRDKTEYWMTWGTRAVFAVLMSRLMAAKAVVERQDGHGLDADDLEGSIENLGDQRWNLSLKQLRAMTGLSKEAVIAAKRELKELGIIDWMWANSGEHRPDGGTSSQLLRPSFKYRVQIKAASPGKCHIILKGAG